MRIKPPTRKLKLVRGKWHLVWNDRQDGKTVEKRISLRTNDRAEADRQFQEYIRQSNYDPETISEVLDKWYNEKQDLLSIKLTKSKIKILNVFFGNLLPETITERLCKEYRVHRAGVTNTTVRNEITILRCAVRFNKPHTKAIFWLPSPNPPKDRHLTKKEFRRLIGCAVLPHLKLFLELAIGTAGRSTAILELTWDRIYFDRGKRGLINLNNRDHKNKGRATVPMTPKVREALLEAYKTRTCEHVVEYDSHGIKRISRPFERCCRLAQLEGITPHILRHTAAVWMAEDRKPMSEISAYLGHKNSRITEEVYAKYSPEFLTDTSDALDY